MNIRHSTSLLMARYGNIAQQCKTAANAVPFRTGLLRQIGISIVSL